MVLLSDEAQVEACLRRTFPRLRKPFWTHTMELLGDMGHVESHFGPFGESFSVDAR
jgi:hypothetical protein